MGYNYREINITLLTSCKILSRALHLGGGGVVGGSSLPHKSSGQGGKKKQSVEEQLIERQKTVTRACSTGSESLQKIAACVKTSTARDMKGCWCDEVQVVISAHDGWEGGRRECRLTYCEVKYWGGGTHLRPEISS